MPLFKMLGAISIALSGTLFYLESIKHEKQKIRQADGFISLLRYVKKQIDCFSAPISAIISQCSEEILRDCGIDKNNIKGLSYESYFKSLLRNVDFYVDKEAIEILDGFSGEFGRAYREEQLRSCDYYISELVKYREKIGANAQKTKKLRFAVCFCISASLIILLI